MKTIKTPEDTSTTESWNGNTRNPSYKETYHNLVTRENLDIIKKIIKDHDYYDSETIDNIQYQELNSLPHFFVTVDFPDYTLGHYAMLDGIFVNIDAIIPQWHGKFYLGIMIIRKASNEKLKQFIDPARDMEHELHHLHRLIEHIDKHPDYIEKSMIYNVGSSTLQTLDESIAFEVKKIFLMEVPILMQDFDMGENHLFSYEEGTVTKITVDDKDDFVRYQVALYLAELHEKYREKFPEQSEQIKDKIEREINKQGKTLFGENCMMGLMMSLMKYFSALNTEGTRYEVGEI